MNVVTPPRRQSGNNPPRLLIYCLLLSLLLHIATVLLLPLLVSQQTSQEEREPTIVRLIDLPRPHTAAPEPEPEKKEFEIDQLPLQPEPEVPVEAQRKALKDQRVPEEQAPEGDDVRDQSAAKSPPPPPAPAPSPRQQKTPAPPAGAEQQKAPPDFKETAKERSAANRRQSREPTPVTPPKSPATTQAGPVEPTPPMLSPQQLLPDIKTLDRIARADSGDRERRKQRDDVAIGDTIWLNLQHDLLVSFFRRFHDRVERVWNYPREAAQTGTEGTLELLITVDKQGKLLDVDLRRSSGSDILDFEAIQAVYRAAPFGPLTKHYPHDRLNIRAHFSYRLVGKYIYGRRP